MAIFTDDITVEPGSSPIVIDGGGATAVKVDGSGVTQPVSGTVSVGNFPATQPVSGTVTANQGTAQAPAGSWPVEVTDGTNILGTSTHPLQTISANAATSTVTQVTSVANTNTQLLVANANRKKTVLFFSSGIWHVKLGTGASTTSFTYYSNASNTTIEITGWTGEIDVLCTTSGKLVNVTELS